MGIRSFIAIEVPLELIERIAGAQREIERVTKANADTVRWTRPEQMHVTLKFLGNVPDDRLGALERALAEAVVGSVPFELSLENFGCFPSPRNPSVLWVGLGGQVTAIRQLQRRIEAQTHGFSSQEENREYHPHLTIGRIRERGKDSRRLAEGLSQFRLSDGNQWIVREVVLMRSNLSPHGAIHIRLATAQLAA
jgi:RNA 2',3'-cyclic 3'-phosphodiesterase